MHNEFADVFPEIAVLREHLYYSLRKVANLSTYHKDSLCTHYRSHVKRSYSASSIKK